MKYPSFFYPKNSYNLFGLRENFAFISKLYFTKNLPKVLMFSGVKGNGKSTLINHFLYSIFDSKNYNKEQLVISEKSSFLKQLKDNIFSNIIYLNGVDFKSVKVEDIRNLKKKILQSTISDKDRFIIFDDIESFNNSSLNGLLKIIEEPSKKNFFFLINNKSKPLIDTVKSRTLEIKIILDETQRLNIIKELVELYELELILDPKSSKLSPGNFIKFNHICMENNISPTNNFALNLSILLNLYKKDKDLLFIDLLYFLADYYLRYLRDNNSFKNDQIFEIKSYIFKNLNNFTMYNINQNSLVKAVSEKLNYE